MCKHKELELIGRIENYQGHRIINLYECKECNTILIMKDLNNPLPFNMKFCTREAEREVMMAV